MFGSIVNMAVNTVTAPVRMVADAVNIIDGLTVGELRYKAILSLGEDVALGMTQAELIEWYRSR